jgi:hypothetical protein
MHLVLTSCGASFPLTARAIAAKLAPAWLMLYHRVLCVALESVQRASLLQQGTKQNNDSTHKPAQRTLESPKSHCWACHYTIILYYIMYMVPIGGAVQSHHVGRSSRDRQFKQHHCSYWSCLQTPVLVTSADDM